MSDTYGGLELPVPTTPTPIGDPALLKVGQFVQAVVNSSARTAWDALRPRAGTEDLPIRNVFTHDPARTEFNDKHLPALFVYRGKTEEELLWSAEDWRKAEGRIQLLWVYPPAKPEHLALRLPFANAIVKCVESAIESGRDPAWVDAGDSDVTAGSIAADADSIKLSIATSMVAQTYSGAALDGVVGTSEMTPRRIPTVTTTAVSEALLLDPGDGGAGEDEGGGSTAAYNTEQPIVVTYVDWYGQTQARSFYLTQGLGGETLTLGEDVAQVVSLAVPAQPSELGSFTFGTAAVTGRGSVLLPRAGLLRLELTRWQLVPLDIEVADPSGERPRRLRYDGVLMHAIIHERLVRDLAVHYSPHENIDIDYYEDELDVGRAELPDSNG